MVPHEIAEDAQLSARRGCPRLQAAGHQHEVALTFVLPDRQRVLADRGERPGTTRRSSRTRPHARAPAAASTSSTRPAARSRWSCSARPGRLLGREHDPQRALELDDDRHRREPQAAPPLRSGLPLGRGTDRDLRRRLRRPRHRRVLRGPRPRGRRARRPARAHRSAPGGRGADLRAGARRGARARPRPDLASRSTCARRSTARTSCTSPSGRRRRTPAMPTSRAVWTVVDELPGRRAPRRSS